MDHNKDSKQSPTKKNRHHRPGKKERKDNKMDESKSNKNAKPSTSGIKSMNSPKPRANGIISNGQDTR